MAALPRALDPTGDDRPLADALARFGLPREAPARLAGDAGARRYFRVATAAGAPAVLVLYPSPSSAPQAKWTAIRGALERAGLRVPACLEDAPELGASLIEDLGDRDLGDELREATPSGAERLVSEAEDILPALRAIEPEAARENPPFDAAFFLSELAATRRWALDRDGERPLPAGRAAMWEELAPLLAAEAAACGEPVPTHRDFHANNLMRAKDGRLALIDFQDLRLGPPDYDPVSLRFERAGARCGAAGRRYESAVLLQRAWKVLGTFEKMLRLGREVYRPHRDATLGVLRRETSVGSQYAPLLGLLGDGV
jgi:aminoglycoside/choline kinase family phosphotransferase